ncbi:putative protein tag-53, partial [Actinomortierella wolfii]
MKSQNIACFCWFLVLWITAFVAAQQNPAAPMPASDAAYVKYRNKFYIMGGTTTPQLGVSEAVSNQFFVLDLSKPWKSHSPAWTILPAGSKTDAVGAAMSLDGKIFMTFPGLGYVAHRFFFENNTWSTSKAPLRESMYEATPVTMPGDGKVLIVGGEDRSETIPLDIYSFDTDQTVTTSLPKTGLLNMTLWGYKAVWSEYLQSAVFYGGWDTPASQLVNLYHPASKKWSKL